MKWLVFTGAVAAALISLGVLAVDQPNVAWEAREAHCPHCRAIVEQLSDTCKECRRTFDWVPHEETCRWCLDREEVGHLKDLFEELDLDKDPLPGALAGFPIAYFRSMDEGKCTYCAGLGQVMQDGAEVNCPICRGDSNCIACGGDRTVVFGHPAAHQRWLDRLAERKRGVDRSKLTGLPLQRAKMVDLDVAATRGFAEAEQLEDTKGRPLLRQARLQVERAFRALNDERANAEKSTER